MPEIHLSVLAILGVCVAGGVVGAWIFKKLKIPQVVGYIVVGLLIGETGLGLLHPADITALSPFTNFALGLIGFLVGGELQGSIFKKYGKQFFVILLGEGLAAFFLVAAASTMIVYCVTHNVVVALAAGLVFGAIASATDPASTIDVLWEYRSAGVLTTAIIAIIALDDALAMTLYGLSTSIATILTQSGGETIGATMLHTAIELGGGIALGLAAGFILDLLLRYIPQTDKRLGITIGIIMLCIALAVAFHVGMILATMAAGIVLVNRAPRRSKKLFEVIHTFSSPIYIVFFVLIGARLSLKNMPAWMWGLVAAYVLMLCLGKWMGAYWGSHVSHAEKTVKDNLGMALFAQGGVAVGLSIVASQHLQHIQVVEGMSLGDAIIFTVTATTLCVQLIGPEFTKLAIKRAGEIGRNVTEEDVMAEWKVIDVVNTEIEPLDVGLSLETVVRDFAEQDTFVYPVISEDRRIIGVLTFDMLKEALIDRDSLRWLVVDDVMEPVHDRFVGEMNLGEALLRMQTLQTEAIPVVESLEGDVLLGVLVQREARQKIGAEIIRRHAVAT